ncbi:MAG: 4Fe-4S binding protein [Bacillota bacterium]
MEWEADAGARLEKVPFFIRKKVKRQIEEFVQRQGGSRVTSRDVTEARRALAGRAAGRGEESVQTDAGSLSASDLARIEDLVERGVAIEGLKTSYHEVKVCGGAAGCPLTLTDDRQVSLALAGVLDASGLDGHIAGQIDGPVLFHHRFRVALAGCPNACSQPQIVDFGVIAQSVPGRGDGRCTGCGLCVKVCQENAASLTGEGPVFDTDNCLNCGQCARSCPTEAIREVRGGFKVLAGGKLGRHPRLAEILLDLADEKELKAALEGAVRLYMGEGRDGERFSGLVERLGIDVVREKATRYTV